MVAYINRCTCIYLKTHIHDYIYTPSDFSYFLIRGCFLLVKSFLFYKCFVVFVENCSFLLNFPSGLQACRCTHQATNPPNLQNLKQAHKGEASSLAYPEVGLFEVLLFLISLYMYLYSYVALTTSCAILCGRCRFMAHGVLCLDSHLPRVMHTNGGQ